VEEPLVTAGVLLLLLLLLLLPALGALCVPQRRPQHCLLLLFMLA
jgi:hypothetical protein